MNVVVVRPFRAIIGCCMFAAPGVAMMYGSVYKVPHPIMWGPFAGGAVIVLICALTILSVIRDLFRGKTVTVYLSGDSR